MNTVTRHSSCVTGLLHSARCPQGPPLSEPVSEGPFFLWLNHIPLYGWLTLCSSFPPPRPRGRSDFSGGWAEAPGAPASVSQLVEFLNYRRCPWQLSSLLALDVGVWLVSPRRCRGPLPAFVAVGGKARVEELCPQGQAPCPLQHTGNDTERRTWLHVASRAAASL